MHWTKPFLQTPKIWFCYLETEWCVMLYIQLYIKLCKCTYAWDSDLHKVWSSTVVIRHIYLLLHVCMYLVTRFQNQHFKYKAWSLMAWRCHCSINACHLLHANPGEICRSLHICTYKIFDYAQLYISLISHYSFTVLLLIHTLLSFPSIMF